MGFPVRLCALVGRFSDPRVAESVNVLIPHLLSRQVQVIISTETTYSGDRGRHRADARGGDRSGRGPGHRHWR